MEEIETWASELDALMERIGDRFGRADTRGRARNYLKGLLSPVERKNGWQLAEAVGEGTPYGTQQFLYRARWDADGVRDDLREYVVTHLGDDQAVLVVDETGFVKKGTHSAGVKRQYSGTAGRIENCQIGVFLTYATRRGQTFLDRALYLPREWTEDRERCRQAGIPDGIEFSTKPELAWQMLKRAVEHQVPFAWVTGDCVYGDYRSIRLWLETHSKGYVLAVSAKEYVMRGWQQWRVGDLLARLPAEGWMCLSAGEGAKGPRRYDWLLIALNAPLVDGWQRWLLVRRSLRGCLKRSSMGQTTYHQTNHDDIDHSFAGGNQTFVVLAQSTGLAQPSQGAFHHPAAWKHRKPFLVIRAQHHLQTTLAVHSHPVQKLTAVGAVHPDPAQLLARAAQPAQQQPCPVAILDGSGRDDDRHQQPHCIDQDMAFTAIDLLAFVVTPRARHGAAFDTLTIQATGGGLFVAASLAAYSSPQRVVDALPGPVIPPSAKIAIHALPFGIFLGQHPPLDATHSDVQDPIDDLTHIQATRSSARFGRWDQRFDNIPLAVG